MPENKALRDVYGEALKEIGATEQQVVVLDADVSCSTKSCLFGQAYPERFYNVGISEANMTAMAAGFAACGKTPVVNTFAVFLSTIGLCPIREMISYDNLNVKLVGTYGGMSNAADGATHHANEDISNMRSIPNMSVLVFSDPVQTRKITIEAIANHTGPVYLRSPRQAPPAIYSEDTEFPIGKGKIVRDGKDAAIIACGIMVHVALAAAQQLSKSGKDVRVVDMYSIKPLDKELVLKCADENGVVITVEEHSIYGGLGSAVAEVLAETGTNVKFRRMGIPDRHACSGDHDELLDLCGLSSKHLIKTIEELI